MTGSISKFLIKMAAISAAILISGCTTNSQNHADQASVFFECIPTKNVVIRQVHAIEDEGELVIYGKVKRTINNCCDATRGRVDIHLVGPDDSVLDTVSVLYSPRNIPKARSRSSSFTARLPYTIPYGCSLRMSYNENRNVADSTSHPLTTTTH